MTETRKLAVILAADVAGYSRLAGADEEGTVSRLRALRQELIDPAISANRGRIVNTAGDSILIEFSSVVDAVRCALTSTPTRVGEGRKHLNFSNPIKRQTLCRKIGLRHEAKRLEGISVLVERWFAARGGKLWMMKGGGDSRIKSGQVAFAFTPPAVPRSKNRGVEGARSRPNRGVEGAKSAQIGGVEGAVYKKDSLRKRSVLRACEAAGRSG